MLEVPIYNMGQENEVKYWDKKSTIRVKRDGEFIKLQEEEFLRIGDVLGIVALVEFFTEIISQFGEELIPEVSTELSSKTARIVVINKDVVGKTIMELDIAGEYNVLLNSIKQASIELPVSLDYELKKGDILNVVGLQENVDLLGEKLGHVDRDIAETDMVTFAFGIVIGVIVGLFSITVGQLSIGLGSAGGLLASGLIIGYMRSVKPIFGRLPEAARWFLMDFGLLLFMAGVGLRAGGEILETLVEAGPILVIAGMAVTITPILVGYFIGRKILKINPVLLFGEITGSMTSGAALSVVTKAADSPMPSLGYTGAYAFANVILTIAGSLILFF